MIDVIKKVKNIIKDTFMNFSINHFLLTIKITNFKLNLLKKFTENTFGRLLFLTNYSEKKINGWVEDIIFILDKFFINIRMILHISMSIINGNANLPEEELLPHNSSPNQHDVNMHMRYKCFPNTGYLGYSLSQLPYKGFYDNQNLFYNLFRNNIQTSYFNLKTIQGYSFPNTYVDLPVHTSYTYKNGLCPIFFNFFKDTKLPFYSDINNIPVVPGYVMQKPNGFTFRYVPDHMVYCLYKYNGINLSNECPFDAVSHPAHKGIFGFQFEPVYKVYRVEAFERNNGIEIDGMTGYINKVRIIPPSRPTYFSNLPKTISNISDLADWKVICDENPMQSMNQVIIFGNPEINDWIIISDRDLDGRVIECWGRSRTQPHFLHNKKLVVIKLGNNFDSVTKDCFGEVTRIDVRQHYDIKDAVLVTKYRSRI